jgi:hypothetical protein
MTPYNQHDYPGEKQNGPSQPGEPHDDLYHRDLSIHQQGRSNGFAWVNLYRGLAPQSTSKNLTEPSLLVITTIQV